MTVAEMSNEFDVLYLNITSNLAPGLDEYEKSVFLTKALNEILKAYFDPKGNKFLEGFDGSLRRLIDFSKVIKLYSTNPVFPFIYYFTGNEPIPDGGTVAPIPGSIFFPEVIPDARLRLKIIVNTGQTEDREYSLLGDQITIQVSIKSTAIEITSSYLQTALIQLLTEAGSMDNADKIRVNLSHNITLSNNDDVMFYVLADAEKINYNDYIFDKRSLLFIFPSDVLFVVNESVESSENGLLRVLPINFLDYDILMTKPYLYPPKHIAWRLLNSAPLTYIEADFAKLIIELIAPGTLTNYKIRYVRKPNPIILANLGNLSVEGERGISECELDSILHPEIVLRAVELAKAAYLGDLNTQLALGVNSETNMGIIAPSDNRRGRYQE